MICMISGFVVAQDGLSLDGTALYLGSAADNNPLWEGAAGAVLSVLDSVEPANEITFASNRPLAEWLWKASGGAPLMMLDLQNNLVLFDPDTLEPDIILSPTGGFGGGEGTEPVILLDGFPVLTEISLASVLPEIGGELFLPLVPESLAYGVNNTINGPFAFAGGEMSVADGPHSVALGYQAEATHSGSSYAIGYNVLASGKYSLAIGHNAKAKSVNSVAIGAGSKATAGAATAIGKQTLADGHVATAMGWGTSALGEAATSMGQDSVAAAPTSTATGLGTFAQGHSQFVLGAFNEASGDAAIRNPFDEALILGNGESDAVRSTAFSVTWAGDVHARGGIRADGAAILSFVPPQGDLSMGEFTAMPGGGGGGTQ